MTLSACGGYWNHKTEDLVLAAAWSSDGRAVYLLQEVTYRWNYVGLAPHIVDPHADLGKLVLLDSADKRMPIVGFEDWWRIYVALPRTKGRGFVVGLRQTTASGEREYACILVETSGEHERCRGEDRFGETHTYVVNDSNRIVHLRERNVHVTDMISGEGAPLDDPFLGIPWASSNTFPCWSDFSVLAPDQSAWVVACARNKVRGLWLIDRTESVNLLVPFGTDGVGMPQSSSSRMSDMADQQRPFWQTFGLAWSPDSARVYYCGNRFGPAIVVDIATRQSLALGECLTGAGWSPDGRRIAGTDAKGLPRQITIPASPR